MENPLQLPDFLTDARCLQTASLHLAGPVMPRSTNPNLAPKGHPPRRQVTTKAHSSLHDLLANAKMLDKVVRGQQHFYRRRWRQRKHCGKTWICTRPVATVDGTDVTCSSVALLPPPQSIVTSGEDRSTAQKCSTPVQNGA